MKRSRAAAPSALESHADELGQFIAGASDCCALSWDATARPTIAGASGACAALFGLAPAQLRGRPAGELFAGGERAARDLAQGREGGLVEKRALVRLGGVDAGRQFSAQLTLRALPGGVVALVRDLSAGHADADGMLRAEDLGRFASLVAHEVRNPLSAVKITLQTLERQGRLQPNDLRRAAIAIREVGNIETLLSEVLEFARPPTLARMPIDPRGPVREAVEEFGAAWAARGVQLRLTLPDRMAPVQADPTRLRTATRLLVRLAALAAEEVGGGDVAVALRELPPTRAQPGRLWELMVRDPGRPLSSDERAQAFVPFNPSRARGSGLALAVVARIAREHGGEVLLRAESPRGNVVEMRVVDE